MAYGTWTAYNVLNPVTGAHFGGSIADVPIFGGKAYIALTAFVINILVATVLTVILRAVKAPAGVDQTEETDFLADAGDPRVSDLPPVFGEEPADGTQQQPRHRG